MSVKTSELATLQAALGQALGQPPDTESLNAPDEEEDASPRRRKGLVPKLEAGDLTMLRMLASWRFASPGALAAISWPDRTSEGQEWRMRRFVDCEWLGRRRLRFATTRHVVWARPPATRVVLGPAPPAPRSPGLLAALERWRFLRDDAARAPAIAQARDSARSKNLSRHELEAALERAWPPIEDAIQKGDKPLERHLRSHLLALEDLTLELPAPEPALVPPRWSEHVARHGWMRSVVAAAYVKAGWQYSPAGIGGLPLQALKRPDGFAGRPFHDRVFSVGAPPYPFDLALGRRSDGKPLLHILVVDDLQSALDRFLYALPIELPGRSSRIAVRFFPIDDVTIWSDAERRHVFESPRVAAMRTNLQAVGLWDVPSEHQAPKIAPWAAHTATWVAP
jgi:hypothetical protein